VIVQETLVEPGKSRFWLTQIFQADPSLL